MGISRKKISLFDILNVSGYILFSIIVLYPFWQTIVLSFSDAKASSSLGVHLWPDRWITDAYEYVFSYGNVMKAYVNTIIRTVAGTFLIVGFTILAAYPLSKKDLPFRNVFTVFFLIAMFFSGGMIPDYLLVKNLGLLDNSLSLILPSAVNVFFIIIMRNYFMTIDKGVEESAIIDGANYFQILMKIIIPISKPVIATVALWAAVYHWNEWFHALVYIQDDSKTVLQIVVRDMLTAMDMTQNAQMGGGGMSTSQLLLSNVRAATVIISIGPIVLIYPFVQKYFIKGIMIGSLKG
ncbi:binding-protein-dependent transport system inner membrane protein [Neobacillus bataviensis LMG 21833]|uniref:Binding-protein-dependent transport system inner membrane protein n=1 Tax=Neobacillus bataviensis LMG 21833 TaxID=1117379 RepID=K6DWG2_9BACI|nr:carbohydrate ABC transporter permease [Neobacillus bataviensis]EKN65196.1 binding-protein-dependent transport system inner membrane protein [Neobacillus bataviensis LMG 21833]